MTEALAQSDRPTDAVLIQAVRGGNTAAYGLLYERHLGAIRRAAGSFAKSVGEREDLIAEAFTLVLRALRTGSGPVTELRPYLLVTMRHVWIASYSHNRATVLCDDVPDRVLVGLPPTDPVGRLVLTGVIALRSPRAWA